MRDLSNKVEIEVSIMVDLDMFNSPWLPRNHLFIYLFIVAASERTKPQLQMWMNISPSFRIISKVQAVKLTAFWSASSQTRLLPLYVLSNPEPACNLIYYQDMAGYIKKIARYLKKEEVHCSTPAKCAFMHCGGFFNTKQPRAGTGEIDFF